LTLSLGIKRRQDLAKIYGGTKIRTPLTLSSEIWICYSYHFGEIRDKNKRSNDMAADYPAAHSY